MSSPPDDPILQTLADNLRRVQDQVRDAAHAAGRPDHDVQLIAVTKYTTSQRAAALAALGCSELGESRPQELIKKAQGVRAILASSHVEPANRPAVHWHLIGHLQRNKVKSVLPYVSLIHSVDSQRLLEALEEQAAEILGKTDRGVAIESESHEPRWIAERLPLQVLLEVNISGDPAKHGFAPSVVPEVIVNRDQYPHLEIQGLMAMAQAPGDLARAEENFRQLRLLRDSLASATGGSLRLSQLSMGMSGDFHQAIAQGSTLVRIGSALFEGLDE